jgi:hypothetical protein
MRVGLSLCAQRLNAADSDDFDPRGSAVLIGHNLAITAAHNIADLITHMGTELLAGGSMQATFHLFADQTFADSENDPKALIIRYSVVEVCMPPWADIAVLRLSPWSQIPKNLALLHAKLSLTIPSVGDRMSAFGYYDTGVNVEKPATELHVTIKRRPATSIGQVTEIYPEGRAGTAKGSCFATDALYEGGMSGGPVFTDAGRVCGLISTCMKGDESAPHYSTVALLWPIMALAMKFQLPSDSEPKLYTFMELAKREILDAEGWERVELEQSLDGTTSIVKYRAND